MTWHSQNVVRWLLTEGVASRSVEELSNALGDRLLVEGAPLWRLRLAMRTVHPLVSAISTTWERESAPIVTQLSDHGLEQHHAFMGSPLQIISSTRQPFRRDLRNLSDTDHFSLHELTDRGATDYFGLPLFYGDHLGGVFVVTTDHPQGFTDHDIAGFQDVALALAPLSEVHRLNTLSHAVTDAYLGPRTGPRVLNGEITRGNVEEIEAAVFVSDLRDWTGLNARLPANEVMDIANTYFDVIDTSVRAFDGEILKFIGDGVLAIFPCAEGRETACQNARDAAQQALRDHPADSPPFGIGLHVGRVQYGNIGAARRLDFTVLGQTVNIAARIEALCSETGERLLMSSDIAGTLPDTQRSLGLFPLKGLPEPVEVFAG